MKWKPKDRMSLIYPPRVTHEGMMFPFHTIKLLIQILSLEFKVSIPVNPDSLTMNQWTKHLVVLPRSTSQKWNEVFIHRLHSSLHSTSSRFKLEPSPTNLRTHDSLLLFSFAFLIQILRYFVLFHFSILHHFFFLLFCSHYYHIIPSKLGAYVHALPFTMIMKLARDTWRFNVLLLCMIP